jgi:hypothetical protein
MHTTVDTIVHLHTIVCKLFISLFFSSKVEKLVFVTYNDIGNEMKVMRYLIATCVFLSCATFLFGEGGEYDWLKGHIVVRTSESVTCDANGEPLTVSTTKRSQITLSQTESEQKKRDKHGKLVTVSRTRTTTTTDTDRQRTTVNERELTPGAGFEVVRITSSVKTATGNVATVKARNKSGELVVVQKTIASKDEEGVTTITVEKPDKHGKLVVKSVSSSY